MSDEVPPLLVEQRVRNRMIEYWEWVSATDRQQAYQNAVPYVSVPDEAINQWEDWQDFPSPVGHYLPPVFTPEEARMIDKYHQAWDEVADATPQFMPSLIELRDNDHWHRLMAAAQEAFELFMRRGKFDENRINAQQDVAPQPAARSKSDFFGSLPPST